MLQNYTLTTYIMLLTNVSPITLIKKSKTKCSAVRGRDGVDGVDGDDDSELSGLLWAMSPKQVR